MSHLIANQPVVLDLGSGNIQGGFAGGDRPSQILPTCIGRIKHQRVMKGGALEGKEIAMGNDLIHHRGAYRLDNPMEHGRITNWEDMERLWSYMFDRDQLDIKTNEHPIMITERIQSPWRMREKLAEVFFEEYGVPALFVAPQAILSLYASGRTTGVVLDSGAGVTQVVPVYEGLTMPHCVQRMDLGGRDITEYLRVLLRRSGYQFDTSSELDIVRQIKEEHCCLGFNRSSADLIGYGYNNLSSSSSSSTSSTTPTNATTNINDSNSLSLSTSNSTSISGSNNNNSNIDGDKIVTTEYDLPDKTRIILGAERYRAPEILFRPDLIGSEYRGVQDLVVKSIMKSDIDMRPTLFSQIVVAGGSTLFPVFCHRLLNEIRKLSPKYTKIRIFAPPERLYSTWIGGSILASLNAFKDSWITQEEWQSEGGRIFDRKTL